MIISPSDLSSAFVRTGEAVQLGGRILSVEERALLVADAFEATHVPLNETGTYDEGDLVVIEGIVSARRQIAKARVVRHTRTGFRVHKAETTRFTIHRVSESLRRRQELMDLVRGYFRENHFLEVDTPQMVVCPGLDLHLDPFEITGTGPSRSLITSPEYQMKRLLVGGIPRCFQFIHCFRRDERGLRHNPEFTMLEWYRAFAEVGDVMADTETVVRSSVTMLSGKHLVQLGGRNIDVSKPFERITVIEAFERFAGCNREQTLMLAESNADAFFRILVDQVEPALSVFDRPVFLTDYPAPFASLARRSPKDPRVSERFELYLGGIELCNGFGELTDPQEQRTRFAEDQAEREKLGLKVPPLDERFLAALDEGMPDSSGNALGLDRLLAICLGTEDISRVLAFPDHTL